MPRNLDGKMVFCSALDRVWNRAGKSRFHRTSIQIYRTSKKENRTSKKGLPHFKEKIPHFKENNSYLTPVFSVGSIFLELFKVFLNKQQQHRRFACCCFSNNAWN